MLQEQQEGEIKSSYSEKKVMVEEKVPCKVESEEHLQNYCKKMRKFIGD